MNKPLGIVGQRGTEPERDTLGYSALRAIGMGMAAVLAVCTMQWITGPAIGPFTATLVGWPIRIFAFLTSFILWFGMDSWPRQTKRVTRAFMALVQIIVGLLLIWWLVSRG